MRSTAVAEQEERRDPPPARSRWTLLLVALSGLALLAAVCVIGSYFAFHYPIKRDRYSHGFSERVMDRLTAYALLFRSPFRVPNATMPVESIHRIVQEVGDSLGVDTCLVNAVVIFESGLNPNTITTTGAMGLMALQPETAKVLGVQDPFDPRQNIDGGTRLLKRLLDEFPGDVTLTLAAYNAGPGAVKRYSGIPPYRETEDCVNHVGRIYGLCQAQPVLVARGRRRQPDVLRRRFLRLLRGPDHGRHG